MGNYLLHLAIYAYKRLTVYFSPTAVVVVIVVLVGALCRCGTRFYGHFSHGSHLQLATGTPKPLAAATAHLMLHGGSKEAAIGVFIHKNRLSAWQNVQ